MADPFIGEIRMFGGNYAPRNWAFCDGQYIQFSQNEALGSLLNGWYGGDGRTNFAVPDMRGRIPMHFGSGPGVTPRQLGSRFGYENITITTDTMPTHSHSMVGTTDPAVTDTPTNAVFAKTEFNFYDSSPPTDQKDLSPQAIGDNNPGGQDAHYNMMPFQCVSFIISLHGAYPQRN